MKDVVEFIERLLWFIYRVFIVLMPSAILVFISAVVINEFLLDIDAIIRNVIDRLKIPGWIVFLCIVFCVNLIQEGMWNNFDSILRLSERAQFLYQNDTSLAKLFAQSPQNFEVLKAEDQLIRITPSIFNFALLRANQKSAWFNNYFWFLISREYLFANLTTTLLLASLFYLPFVVYKIFCLNYLLFLAIELVQIGSLVLIFMRAKSLLNINYPDKTMPRNFFTSNLFHLTIPLVLFFVSLLLFWNIKLHPYALILIINSLLFLIVPYLVMRAFREHFHCKFLILTSYVDKLDEKKNSE